MKAKLNLLISLVIILSSLLLQQSNGIKEIIVVLVITVAVYNRLYNWSMRFGKYNPNLHIIFSLSFLISFLFLVWINIISIQKGSTITPLLPGDGLSYFEIGSELALTDKALTDVSLNYIGYPLFLSWLFTIFSPHLIYGLLANMLLLFINIFLISECVFKVTKKQKHFQSSFIILLLTSSFMATGFMLLKDIFIVTSITLSYYASLNLLNHQALKKNYLILIVSVIVMALFRITFMWVPIAIYVLVTFNKRKIIKLLPVVIGLLSFGIYIGNKLSLQETSIDQNISFAVSNQVISQRLDSGGDSFISSLISGYDNWGVIKKALFLPITTGIQYITPFDVYNIDYMIDYPFFFVSKNYNLIWLIFIGPLALFSILNIKVIKKPLLLKITYFGIILYVLPAFIFGGAIPRYAVPFYPLLLPIMAVNLTAIKTMDFYKQKWYKFLMLYFLIFLFLLIVYVFFKGLK